MGPDLRYHLATLITVLCAVIVGVIIGAHLTDPRELQRREDRLNAKVERALLESKQTSADAALARQQAGAAKEELALATKALVPSAVRGLLVGRRVALIHSGGLADTSIKDSIAEVVRQAGGELVSVTGLDPQIAEPEKLDLVAQALKWSPAAGANRLDQLAQHLAAMFAAGDAGGSMEALARTRVVNIASDYQRPVHAVVLLGGADTAESRLAESVDRPLIKALLASRLNVVGCEVEKAGVSYMPEYARQRVATVDNVDAWEGRVSLVYALAGHRDHYGVKSGARRKLPTLVQ